MTKLKYIILFYIALISCKLENNNYNFTELSSIYSCQKVNYTDLSIYSKVKNNERFKFLENIEIYSIIYFSGGLKIHGYIIKPKNIDKPLPLIIYCRGGNRKFGEITDDQSLFLAGFSSNGYVILASNYSGSSKSEGADEFGGDEVNDVLQLFEISKELPFIDTSRIAIFGESRGGMMMHEVLKNQRNNLNIKAAISIAGPSDLSLWYNNRPEMERLARILIPNYINRKEDAIYKRSVIQWVDSLSKHVPLLLIHGDSDERVNVEHSISLAKKLKKLDHPHKLIIYKDAKHNLSSVKDSLIFERNKWLNTYLR